MDKAINEAPELFHASLVEDIAPDPSDVHGPKASLRSYLRKDASSSCKNANPKSTAKTSISAKDLHKKPLEGNELHFSTRTKERSASVAD